MASTSGPVEIRQAQARGLPHPDVASDLPSLPLDAAVPPEADLVEGLAHLGEVHQTAAHPGMVRLRDGGQPDLVLEVHDVRKIADLSIASRTPMKGLTVV